jgi:hypothetical protein
MKAALTLTGVVAVVVGLLAIRRVRRWRPMIDREVGSYDPGPDLIDWVEAVAPLAVGVVTLILAL